MTVASHALTLFADSCRTKLEGKPEQIAQVDALVAKAEALDGAWYDAQGYRLHSGGDIEAGRRVAQAVAKG